MVTRTLRGDPRISKLARIVTQYSTNIQKGEKVLISGPPIAETLLLAIYREVLRCGAYPTLQVDLPERAEIFYQEAADHQLEYCPVEQEFFAKNFDATLRVLADSNPRHLASVDLDKISRVRIARRKLKLLEKDRIRWNVCMFPTEAFAQEAGVSLMEFENFYFSACFADEEDPVKKWRELRDRQEKWVKKLEGSRTLHIIGDQTDLKMSVENRRICNSWGSVNMPCGEIYTAPVEDLVEGTIFFDFPATYNGNIIEELSLKFKKGQVVEAHAKKGQKVIETILGIDEGSKRVGEIGIGTNYHINHYTNNMLLDEKMGGTIHLALGDAYSETLGQNKSAIHFDLIKDLRNDGLLLFDGVVIQNDGQFTEEFLQENKKDALKTKNDKNNKYTKDSIE